MNTINKNTAKEHLTQQDYMLYGRQMLVPEIGWEGQLKLAHSRVMVIGAGGLGCPVLQYLSGAGVGQLGCVDFDKIEGHNLHRQLLFTPKDIHLPKVKVAKDRLVEHRPHVQYDFKDIRLTADRAPMLLQGYDLVVDGSDNFQTRYIVSDACKALDIPVVYGSILGFDGQISVFGHQGGKTLRDLFATPPPAASAPNCAENGVLATLPGIIGLIMAQEALKLLMGLPVLHNQLMLLNTLNWHWRILSF